MEDIEIEKNVILTAEGLAVFKTLKLAVAADPHIGFEEALGEQLARVQTRMMLEKFNRVIERHGIKEILLDGDIKYSFGKEFKQEWKEIKFFISELLKKVQIKIVKGNHDFYLENMVRDLDVMISREFELNGYLFAHGDGEVERGKKKMTIIGNEHPSVKLRDEIGATRKYPCFLYCRKEKLLVLPAANPWTYGTDILGSDSRRFLSPPLRAANIPEAEVYVLDGQEIYDFKRIRDISAMLSGK